MKYLALQIAFVEGELSGGWISLFISAKLHILFAARDSKSRMKTYVCADNSSSSVNRSLKS